MCEFNLTARVYVSTVVVGQLSYDCFTESGCRIPILGIISINGSVEWLGIPDFHITSGPFWTANILAPSYSWGDGGTKTNKNWGIKPGVPYGSVAFPWSRRVPVCLDYVPRSPGNMCTAARRVRDYHLQSRRLSRMHSLYTRCNPIHNPRSIGGIIIRRVRLINIFCGEFPLVVSVSATFIFFPSLV